MLGERLIQQPLRRHHDEVTDLSLKLRRLYAVRLPSNVHGWRSGHSVATAITDIASRLGSRLSFDLVNFFGAVDQRRLNCKLNHLDPTIWKKIDKFMPAMGIPTGFSFSPLLANLYLEEIDRRFPAVRYADNIMIITDDPERCFIKMRRHLADIGLDCHKIEPDPETFCKSVLPPANPEGVIQVKS
jgi:hypothetical protein